MNRFTMFDGQQWKIPQTTSGDFPKKSRFDDGPMDQYPDVSLQTKKHDNENPQFVGYVSH